MLLQCEQTQNIPAPALEVWTALLDLNQRHRLLTSRFWPLSYYGALLKARIGTLKTVHERSTHPKRLGAWTVEEMLVPSRLKLRRGNHTLLLVLSETGPNETLLSMQHPISSIWKILASLHRFEMRWVLAVIDNSTRHKKRIECNEAVLIAAKHKRFTACVVDISENGCRLKTQMPLFTHAQAVVLHFEEVAVDGTLCNQEQHEDACFFGIQFNESQHDLYQRLALK